MKPILASVAVLLACTLSSRSAETTAKITNVHLCCKSCVSGVQKAVGKVEGASAVADQDSGTVTLNGPDAATVQKAADALVAAGYFGTTDDKNLKLKPATGATGRKVQ